MPLLVIHGHSTLLPWSRFGFVLFCFFYSRKFKQSLTPGTGSQTGTYISYFIFISTGLRPSSFLLLFLLISYILFRIKRRLECAYSSTRSKMSKFRSHTTSPEPKNTSFLPLLNRQHRHFDPWKEPWLYVCVCASSVNGGEKNAAGETAVLHRWSTSAIKWRFVGKLLRLWLCREGLVLGQRVFI